MKHHIVKLLSVVLPFASLVACACTKSPAPVAPAQPSAARESAPDTVVATIGDKKITLAELDAEVAPQMRELEEQRFQTRRQGLETMINQQLVKEAAAQKGMTEEAYLKAEVDAKVTPPTDAEVEKFFNQNANQLPPGSKLADFRERIVNYMSRQGHTEKAKDVFNELRKANKVVVTLTPPAKPRLEVEAKGPERGPQTAKVTIVEFSDFECPFCSRARQTVDQVMKKYEGKARLVFRQFPLSFHAHARKAAEAALCADAQGKFWEMHDAMFSDQTKLEVPSLKETAARLGLDKAKFETCLDKGEETKRLEYDMAAAEKAGVTGTPAFFINGISLSGAQPIEEFERVIDQELATN